MTDKPPRTTTDAGHPRPERRALATIGPDGPILLQDHYVIQKMAQFNRERVPERVVHAKGGAAHGFFEVTEDVTQMDAGRLPAEGQGQPSSCASRPWPASWARPTRSATRGASR